MYTAKVNNLVTSNTCQRAACPYEVTRGTVQGGKRFWNFRYVSDLKRSGPLRKFP